MKKASIMALVLVLTATMFAGCRNMGGQTTNSTQTPATSSSTKPTVRPTPSLPLPSGSTTTPGGATDPSDATQPGTSGSTAGDAARRPAGRGPRY